MAGTSNYRKVTGAARSWQKWEEQEVWCKQQLTSCHWRFRPSCWRCSHLWRQSSTFWSRPHALHLITRCSAYAAFRQRRHSCSFAACGEDTGSSNREHLPVRWLSLSSSISQKTQSDFGVVRSKVVSRAASAASWLLPLASKRYRWHRDLTGGCAGASRYQCGLSRREGWMAV